MRWRRVERSIAARSLFVACVALCTFASVARADVRVKMRDTMGRGSEVTLYLKGSRQRRDLSSSSPDGRAFSWTLINDCARQQFIWLDPINRRYWAVAGGVPVGAIAAFDEQQFPPATPPKSKGTLTEIVTITDTGERREMFGFTARRLKTSTTWEVAPDSCDAGASRMETDGWYIDLMYGIDCSPDLSGAISRVLLDFAGSQCLNKRLRSNYIFRRRYDGDARLGFPLTETMRAYDGRGLVTSTRTQQVLELSTERLDDAIFAVPAGYTRTETTEMRKPSIIGRALSIFR